MKKIIVTVFVAAFLLCLASCALAATPANVVETGTGVSLIPAAS